MDRQRALDILRSTQQFFDRSSSGLGEEDSGFAPAEGMFTAAQQVAHVAHTVEWFVTGVFSPTGMDMDWEEHARQIRAVTSLKAAREWLERAFAAAARKVEETPADQWAEPIRGQILAGAPRDALFGGIAEHTAHHRGALAVYQRLLGKVPAMPYM